MKIGLLIIASEILDGKIADLNTYFFSEYLRRHHQELLMELTVRDDEKLMKDGLKHLLDFCDVVVTSGGLGPTKDDLTKDVLGSYFNRKLVHSAESEKVARDNYSRLKREFTGATHSYSYLPEGFIPLNNSSGFAPGFYVDVNHKIVLSAPGVPREFKSMVEDYFPSLVFSKNVKKEFIDSVNIRTQRVPEEKIFNEVDPELWKKLEAFGDVSSLPIILGVDIGVKIKGQSQEEVQDKKDKVLKIISESPVQKHVWHIGRETLEEVIVKKAAQKNITYGFAESATGGLCSHRITSIPGSSEHFVGGIVSYNSSVKEKNLEVSSETLEKKSAVSFEVAQEMAQGLSKSLKVDIAISITGYAGPGGGTSDKPVGTVYIGTHVKGKSESQEYNFFGDRETLKNRFAQMALMTLLERMENFA